MSTRIVTTRHHHSIEVEGPTGARARVNISSANPELAQLIEDHVLFALMQTAGLGLSDLETWVEDRRHTTEVM